MIAWLRGFIECHVARDATPAEDACESCRDLHCDERQAAECQYRIAAVDAASKSADKCQLRAVGTR